MQVIVPKCYGTVYFDVFMFIVNVHYLCRMLQMLPAVRWLA
jgi:hypothetical protein